MAVSQLAAMGFPKRLRKSPDLREAEPATGFYGQTDPICVTST